MAYVLFGKDNTEQYILTEETAEAAKEALIQAIKSGLPKEARRVDVLCYLFDEMKEWAKTKCLEL